MHTFSTTFRHSKSAFYLANLLFFVFASGSAFQLLAQRQEREVFDGKEAAAREILVKFRETASVNSLSLASDDSDLASIEAVGMGGALRVRSRNRDIAALLKVYANRPDVEYAEPNYIWKKSMLPNDSFFGQQWAFANNGQTIKGKSGAAGADIKAVQAWDLTEGSRQVVVGLLDSGIDYAHSDLVANLWSAPLAFSVVIAGRTITCAAGTHGFNAIARTCLPFDDDDHGTHVGGIVGATGNNGVGVTGVNPVASLMALKFLEPDGGSTSDAIAAIDFAIQTKALFAPSKGANVRIINASFGQGNFSQTLLNEINLANSNDMLFVTSAGNDGTNNDVVSQYPANFNAPNIISVAATDNRDTLPTFSNYGSRTVHLGAPGVNVLSTLPNESYEFESGTSMAAPMVSGAAALVLSVCDLTTAALKSTLLTSVDFTNDLAGRTITGGRLNVYRAITSCLGTASNSPKFTLTALPGKQFIGIGGATTVTVSVAAINGFVGPITLSASGLPANITAEFRPPVLNGSGISSLVLSATAAVAAGTYSVVIQGANGAVRRTAAISLNVGPPVIQSLSVAGSFRGGTVHTVVRGVRVGSAAFVVFGGLGLTATVEANSSFQSEGLPLAISIASDAPIGTQTMTIITAGGTSPPFSGFTVIDPQPIGVGATAGALAAGDAQSVFAGGRFADYYRFNIATASVVTIDMKSTSIDSYLYLLNSSGETILRRDDDSGGHNDSRIGIILLAGDYLIEATSSLASQSGSYTLGLTAADLTALPAFNRAQSLSGTLASTDLACPIPPTTTSDIYQLNILSTQTVTIDLKSTEFDAYLLVLSSEGKVVAQDDDRGGNSNARITVNLSPGLYLVVATSYSLFETGDYTLSSPFLIPDRGGLSLVSSGTLPEQAVGYASVSPDAGMTSPSGVAIFGFTVNGVLVSEAGVPGTSLMQSGRFYAEVGGGVNTGVAMANPGTQEAIVTLSLVGPGGLLGSGTMAIPPNGQIARFVTEPPFNFSSTVTGTLTFDSTAPISVVALRGLTNERSEFLMTTVPVTDLSIPPGTDPLVFPEFADGDGWSTQIVLMNPTDNVLSGVVRFMDPQGRPAATNIGGQSNTSFTYSIAARSSQKLQTVGMSPVTITGSVRVEPNANNVSPAGMAIFARRENGVTVSETGVPAAVSGNAFRLFSEIKGQPGAVGSIETGVAIVNNSSADATVTFELYKLDGTFTGFNGTWILPAKGQDAKFLNEISGFSGLPESFQGILRVSSSASVSLLGLRGRYNERQEFLSTITPPSNEAAPVSTTPLYFPEIADSAGYTTQFILFAGQSNQTTTGTLQVLSPVGQLLNLILY